jgi:hypothetical protein
MISHSLPAQHNLIAIVSQVQSFDRRKKEENEHSEAKVARHGEDNDCNKQIFNLPMLISLVQSALPKRS